MITFILSIFIILCIIFATWALSKDNNKKSFKSEQVEEYFIERTCDKKLSKKIVKLLEKNNKLSIFAEAIWNDHIKIQKYIDLKDKIKMENYKSEENGSTNK